MNGRPLRFRTLAFVVLLSLTLRLTYGQPTDAPSGDPNLSHPNRVVTVAVQDYTISGLVPHLCDAKAFRYGVALFPGYPGITRLREKCGQVGLVQRRAL